MSGFLYLPAKYDNSMTTLVECTCDGEHDNNNKKCKTYYYIKDAIDELDFAIFEAETIIYQDTYKLKHSDEGDSELVLFINETEKALEKLTTEKKRFQRFLGTHE